MYKILVVWALSQEINIIKEQIKKLYFKNIKTSFLTTWIGNYNMILNLTRFLEKNPCFDFVINIWVCWYVDYTKDLLQIARIFNISNNKELIIPNLFNFWQLSSITCSEKIVYDSLNLDWENYVDMESYWFEKVCDSFVLPRIILKVPVDKIWLETKNFDFNKASILLKNNIDYKLLIDKIESYLDNTFTFQRNVVEKEKFEKYKIYFGFTFSENEIFKRLYYRYIALVNDDFNIYFDDNKELLKKNFLKELEKFLENFLVR
jgi:hypothetical protein